MVSPAENGESSLSQCNSGLLHGVILKIMENYFVRILISDNLIGLFNREYEKAIPDSSYMGPLILKKDGATRVGYFYLAVHPKTKETIMRYDIAYCPKNSSIIDSLNIKWNETVYSKVDLSKKEWDFLRRSI